MSSAGQTAVGMSGGAFLLDMIPIVVFVVLVIAFIISRHRFKSEKKHLDQVIESIDNQNTGDEKTKNTGK